MTGNPLRPELIGGSRDAAMPALSAAMPTQPIVYVTGGAQGSHRINRTVGDALPRLLADLPGHPPVRRQRRHRRSGLARSSAPGAATRARDALRGHGRTWAPSCGTSMPRPPSSSGAAGQAPSTSAATSACPPSTSRCPARAATSRRPMPDSWRRRAAGCSSRRTRSRWGSMLETVKRLLASPAGPRRDGAAGPEPCCS